MAKKKNLIRLATVFLVLALSVTSAWLMSQETAEGIYEAALLRKEASGDLQGAIQLFQKILKQFPEKRDVAAKAQFQIGACYEKMGTAEAVKAYELVLKNFADQPELVAAARERLAALRREQTSEFAEEKILPPDIYIESLCLSPDGTKVVGIEFTSGQNVAIYDMAAQRMQLLTHFTWDSSSFYAYFPMFSPDGQKIVYVVGAISSQAPNEAIGLHIMTLDGEDRLLFRADQTFLIPCGWVPDGKAILALTGLAGKPSTLGLIDVASGTFKPIITLQGSMARVTFIPAAISPDGRYVAFCDGAEEGKRDIYIVAVDGGAATVLSASPAEEKDPRWSPDGKYVVFLSNQHGNWGLWGIPIVNGKAGGQAALIKSGLEEPELHNWIKKGLTLTVGTDMIDIYSARINPATLELAEPPKLLAYTPTGKNSRPAWSPDGKYLAFAVGVDSFSLPDQAMVVIMPADGGQIRIFPLSPLIKESLWPSELLWLPDGSGLGFSAPNRMTGHSSLCELKLATGEWKIEPLKHDAVIRWNKDGTGYFFFTDKGLNEHLLKSGETRLVHPLAEEKGHLGRYRLAFSHDQRHAAWRNAHLKPQGGEVKQIITLDLSTGKTQIFDQDLDCPAWTPDDRHILACPSQTNQDLPVAIYVLSLADGTSRTIGLGNSLPKGSQIYRITLSPDGTRITFQARMLKTEDMLIRNVLPASSKK